jgi:CheY-like chemotaxis protein
MNLVSNAAEAVEGSGMVRISTENRYLKDRIKGYDDVRAGEYVVLEVSDNGSGISPQDLASIFEPFYTKKVMGRSGTGLGLAVVWNIVQDHKGYIDVASNERGTRFTLYFPATRNGILEAALSTPLEDYKGNNEIILVVDDVETQREISCKMLETLGYRTIAVASGEEAVRYVKAHPVDLLLLDMIMEPGMSGRETYEKILTFHPTQKAVIASGYAETDDVKAVQLKGAGRYIKKPFTLENIGLAVKEELASM